MLHFIKENGMPPELNPVGRINACTVKHNQIIAFCDEDLFNPNCWRIILDMNKFDRDLLSGIIADAFRLLSLGGKLSRLTPEK